ncbi:MAG TPA: shikimate dehydrogenase [Janthinobacterium sp.]|nr:shikimate dehydrogenase [Janthinobacterium sp.]
MGADRYCVFGNPIAHSKSPEIHAAFAAQTGQDMVYERSLAALDGFAAAALAFAAAGGRGANVTVPFKLEACALASRLTPRARAAGAVNTLSFDGGDILGDNTDGAGLVADIVGDAGVAIEGRRVLLLGAGGAARGVLQAILDQRPAQVFVANRTRATADALALRFAVPDQPGRVAACEFAEPDAPFDIVINATSASLSGALPPVSPAVFGPHTLALDMMYGAAPTIFMQVASGHGARARDGLGMLVEQAAEAFFLWRGVRPDTREVLERMRGAL